MPRRKNTLYARMIQIALEADQKHHMYRAIPPGVLKPDGYQCTGCEKVFKSDQARKKHRIEAIINSWMDFLTEQRDR